MKHLSLNNQREKSNSSSPSPKSRSRSRSRSRSISPRNPTQEKSNTRQRNNNNHEGKLYLANIPLNIPQQRIKQEFEKFGKVLEFKLRAKKDSPKPYYYGSVTLERKAEAELAMNNLTKEYNWTVAPFNSDSKDKNTNKERNLNNLNNNISNLNNLNNFNYNKSSQFQTEDKNKNNINGGMKVREILVGNLPLSTNETDLYKEFFIFGEISKIEIKLNDNQKFGYIKFRLINSAMKALEQNDKMNYKGNVLSVNLSNINQRREIQGNEPKYELNENNCKLIVICLDKNKNNIINEENALNIFQQYGKIKAVLIKNINNRNHIFAEYYKPEDAKIAIDELNKNLELKKNFGDENCEINYYFKNKWNEINPSSEGGNKNFDTNLNNLNLKCNNNINNVNLMNKNIMMPNIGMTNPTLLLQYMQQIQKQNLLNKPLNQLNQLNNINNKSQLTDINQINNINLTNNIINNKNNPNIQPIPTNPLQQNINMSFPYNTRLPFYPNFPGFNLPQNSRNFPNQFPQNQNNNLQLLQALLNKSQLNMNNNNNNINNNMNNNNSINNMNNIIPNYMNMNINNNLNFKNNIKINENKKTNKVEDILNQIMSDKNNQKNNNNNSNNNSDSDNCSINGSHQSTEEMEFEKDYSLETENLPIIWNGYLFKNSKDKTNVDMYKIRGNIDDTYFKEVRLYIINRIPYEEVLKKRELGLVAISPQNITQKENFDSFINFLNEKQRCGVINLNKGEYILYLLAPSEFSKKFYINPKKHLLGIIVDGTGESNRNLTTIPPPVISLTEKRSILNRNKKNDNNKKDNNEQGNIEKLKEELKKLENNNNDDGLKNIEEFIKQNPDIDLKNILSKLGNN